MWLVCPLSGVNWKSLLQVQNDAIDPKRTLVRRAKVPFDGSRLLGPAPSLS